MVYIQMYDVSEGLEFHIKEHQWVSAKCIIYQIVCSRWPTLELGLNCICCSCKYFVYTVGWYKDKYEEKLFILLI